MTAAVQDNLKQNKNNYNNNKNKKTKKPIRGGARANEENNHLEVSSSHD